MAGYSYDVTVSVDQLTDEIDKILDRYMYEVDFGVNEATKMIAQKAKNAVRRNARATFKKYHGQRKYSNGWDLKCKTRIQKVKSEYVVYNRKAPGLAHLLEHGHASPNGGRVPAYVHIAPVQDEVDKVYMPEIKKQIGKIVL